ISLLVEVIRLAQRNPELNSASILERYRGTEHHKHLEKLAVWNHMIPDESLDLEFEAAIRQLRERWAAQQATRLLHQASLSAEDKSKLRELLSQRTK
ncbi:DNA primase, partial [Gammaproteobacteria bacterium]|nr:DNA primase [Gammaproteobacteria bacterium]